MPGRFVFMLAIGFVLFGVGALARTFMNIRIGQMPSDGTPTRSTEVKYLRLVRNNRAPIWPLAHASLFTDKATGFQKKNTGISSGPVQ